MFKRISIIIIWVIGGISIVMFAWISYEYGFSPILEAMKEKSKDNILSISPIWIIGFFSIFWVLLGSVGGIIAIYYLNFFRDNLAQKLQLNNQTVATEILNLKTHIKYIYVMAPVALVFLSLLGIKGYNDLMNISGVSVVEDAAKEWLIIQKQWNKIQGEWTDLKKTVSDKPDKQYVDMNFLKTEDLEIRIKVSDTLKNWAKQQANIAIGEAQLLKTEELEKKLLASKTVSDKPDKQYVDMNFLKTEELEKELLASKTVSDKPDKQYVDMNFLKTEDLETRIKVSDTLKNWAKQQANIAIGEAQLLKTEDLEIRIKVSDTLKNWAKQQANIAIGEAQLLKTEDLEIRIKVSDTLKNWAKQQANIAIGEAQLVKKTDIEMLIKDPKKVPAKTDTQDGD